MTETSAHAAATTVKRHPIAAVIWGIVGGIGVSMILMGRAQIAVGRWTAPIIIIVIMIVLNLLWTYFGPAKKPKGSPPPASGYEPEPEPEPEYEAEEAEESEEPAAPWMAAETPSEDDTAEGEAADDEPEA